MKLSKCKFGTIVCTIPDITPFAVGMVVGITEIEGQPSPLIKFSDSATPIAYYASHLELYEH